MLNVVLVHPQIPQNTGNIGRLTVSNQVKLHLIEPFNFLLDEKAIKRSGMDYWKQVELKIHSSWKNFLSSYPKKQYYFFSTKGKKSIYSISFKKDDFLIFGNENNGLPKEFYQEYINDMFHIPMYGKYQRSLNLSNSVAICLYEALRQIH